MRNRNILAFLTICLMASLLPAQVNTFRPSEVFTYEFESNKEYVAPCESLFAFDWENKILIVNNEDSDYMESFQNVITTEYTNNYKTVLFTSPTAQYTLWFWPDDNRPNVVIPQILIETPFGGPIYRIIRSR